MVRAIVASRLTNWEVAGAREPRTDLNIEKNTQRELLHLLLPFLVNRNTYSHTAAFLDNHVVEIVQPNGFFSIEVEHGQGPEFGWGAHASTTATFTNTFVVPRWRHYPVVPFFQLSEINVHRLAHTSGGPARNGDCFFSFSFPTRGQATQCVG